MNNYSYNGNEIDEKMWDEVHQLEDELDEMYDKPEEEWLSREEIAQKYADILTKYNTRADIYDVREWVEAGKAGAIEDEIKEFSNYLQSKEDTFKYTVSELAKMFGLSEAKIIDAIKKTEKETEDSRSTVFMKELGYEGVDVSHLTNDAQGLSGLDNFSYGTVIYDLKPGTYKRIKEPRKESLNMKIVEAKEARKRRIIEKNRKLRESSAVKEPPIDKPELADEGTPTNVEKVEYVKSKDGRFTIEVVTPRRDENGYMICPNTWESWWE